MRRNSSARNASSLWYRGSQLLVFHFPNSSVSACRGLALGAHELRLALTALRDRKSAVRLFVTNWQQVCRP